MNLADSATAPAGVPTEDERSWGMVAHLAALAFFILPFGNMLGPLVVLLVKARSIGLRRSDAKEALNFNITFLIGAIVCLLLLQLSIGILLGAMLLLFWLVMTIIAALKANEGISYRYPFTLRPIK